MTASACHVTKHTCHMTHHVTRGTPTALQTARRRHWHAVVISNTSLSCHGSAWCVLSTFLAAARPSSSCLWIRLIDRQLSEQEFSHPGLGVISLSATGFGCQYLGRHPGSWRAHSPSADVETPSRVRHPMAAEASDHPSSALRLRSGLRSGLKTVSCKHRGIRTCARLCPGGSALDAPFWASDTSRDLGRMEWCRRASSGTSLLSASALRAVCDAVANLAREPERGSAVCPCISTASLAIPGSLSP